MFFRDVPALNLYATQPWLRQLRDEFNVRHADQIAALLQTDEGRSWLASIGAPVPELFRLLRRFLSEEVLDLKPPNRLLASPVRPSAVEDVDSVRLPREFWVSYSLPAADDLAGRPTCAASSVLTAFELMAARVGRKRLRLSREFLYALAKERDGMPSEDGTTIEAALNVLVTTGVCSESLDPVEPPTASALQQWVDARTLLDAARHRIKNWMALPTAVWTLKRTLSLGKPIVLALRTFEAAWFNPDTVRRGEILMPLTQDERVVDKELWAEAVTLVGYSDDLRGEESANRPGGGFFGFALTYGTTWAREQSQYPLPPGYGVLPYAYVARYALGAYAIDKLLVAQPERPLDER